MKQRIPLFEEFVIESSIEERDYMSFRPRFSSPKRSGKDWVDRSPRIMAKNIIDNFEYNDDLDITGENTTGETLGTWLGGYAYNILKNENPYASEQWIKDLYNELKKKLKKLSISLSDFEKEFNW